MSAAKKAAIIPLEVVSKVLDVPSENIVGPERGPVLVTRARALFAYLASTECGMSDQTIADHMNRDRASVTHMLKLVESIRDHEQIDQWLDQITTRALSPPSPCETTLKLFLGTNLEDFQSARPAPRSDAPLPWGADKALAGIAAKYATSPKKLLSRAVPIFQKHEAWVALYQFKSPTGRHVFTQERIARLSGVTQAAVSRALREASANRTKTSEV
jgi:DNA-binding MarR family transcriptional regulator